MPNETLFLDTAYVLALFNTRDQWHQAAVEWQQKIVADRKYILTTEFVLAEIGDGLSSRNLRSQAVKIIRSLNDSKAVTVVSADSDLFLRGLKLFEDRPDKDWGITDCTSFVVMSDRQVTKALTTDEHFRQAGFDPVLLGS